ncbi:hypothetical protein ABDJ41_01125 [Pedobacter sp. ASV1-7]|uniref:hypothetical protein n=1 Tax=Pedobacter sp. ASV1-7 TaxID=3145237 RepID=UPI0032E890D5
MKKIAILPILLLFVVLVSSCSKKKEEVQNTDKSTEVQGTYQGKLSIASVDYNNVKVKVTRKAANEVVVEPIGGQEYPSFAALTFSNFIYIEMSKSYMSTSGTSRALSFSFLSDSSIEMTLLNNFQDALFSFEGTLVK